MVELMTELSKVENPGTSTMTNQPLTAEAIAIDIIGLFSPKAASQGVGVAYIVGHLEAYAAQQNSELLTNCEKLKAENERLKQQLAWQPIETAPKDETDVDLWVEIDDLQYRVTNAFYCPDEQCWWGPNEYYEAVKLEKQGLKILYWKPVIKPPKEAP